MAKDTKMQDTRLAGIEEAREKMNTAIDLEIKRLYQLMYTAASEEEYLKAATYAARIEGLTVAENLIEETLND